MNNIISPRADLSGQYRLEIKRNGQLIKDTEWFDNLITDNGLNLATIYNINLPVYYNSCQVGTGTSTPIASQVALDSRIAFKNAGSPTNVNSGNPNYTATSTIPYVFDQGAVVGNITEVGIGPDNIGNLFSRALITDTNGNPVSITLLAIDQLTIYYKISLSLSLTETSGSVNLSGTNYTFKSQWINLTLNSPTSYSILGPEFVYDYYGGRHSSIASLTHREGSTKGTLTALPVGETDTGAIYYEPYILGSFTRGVKTTCAISSSNWANGIKGVTFKITANKFAQIWFDTPIIKTNTQVLTLSGSYSWGRG